MYDKPKTKYNINTVLEVLYKYIAQKPIQDATMISNSVVFHQLSQCYIMD